MLAATLPPVRRGVPSDMGETAEALALSYLASYASDAPSTRQQDSYMRAWGMDKIKMFPRNPGVTPGWLMALYTSGSPTKVIIAIEGITSFSQLYTGLLTTPASAQVGTLPGRVPLVYSQPAATIMAAILADPDFQAATNHRRNSVTFTGDSLGAAIAEVLGAMHLAADNTRIVSVRKFASPRVGNINWVNGYDQRIDKTSRYTDNDPIGTFPQTTFTFTYNPLTALQVYTFVQPDPYALAWRVPFNGELVSPRIYGVIDTNVILLQLTQTPVPMESAWWFHMFATYRWAMLNILYSLGKNLNYYRFAYLEHNDEWQWQRLFVPGVVWDSTWNLQAGAAPGDFVLPPELSQTIAYVGDTDNNAGGGDDDFAVGDVGIQDGGAGGGGVWGYTAPMQRIRHRVN